jgi:hypothetical protein
VTTRSLLSFADQGPSVYGPEERWFNYLMDWAAKPSRIRSIRSDSQINLRVNL